MSTATATRTPIGPPDKVGAHKCGHCSFGVETLHKACPGAIDSGKSLWICPCGCKPLTCIRCKSTEHVNSNNWRCVNEDDCDIALEARISADPMIQRLREITAQAREREAEERAARPVRVAHGETPFVSPGKGKCECGCGSPTKSRFAMGHDARLRGVLQRAYAGGDAQAGRELAARGGVWATKAPDVDVPLDAEAFIATRVAERLAAS